MWLQGLGLEFGVELAAQEPGVFGGFDDFYVILVWSASGDLQARAGEDFFVIAIEFVAMAVALADFELAVGAMGEGARREFARPGAEAHGAAHFVDAEEFAQFVNDAMRRLRIELGAVCGLERGDVAGILDGGA